MPRMSVEALRALVVGQTVPGEFVRRLDHRAGRPALRRLGDEGWETWTFAQLAEQISTHAAGLRAFGVEPGHRVLLMMRNRPDFHWLDTAAQMLRATPVSIYNSSSAKEIRYLASHAEARVAVVDDAVHLGRLHEARAGLPLLRHVLVLEPPDDLPDGVHDAAELRAHGSLDLVGLAAAVQPDDIATLVYTSGTTGPPKGVMIDQANVTCTVEQFRQLFPFDDTEGRRVVSYLPMAHIAERMMTHYLGIMLGFDVHCCPDPGLVASYLREAHPEIVVGVPRVWERIYNAAIAAIAGDAERKAQFDQDLEVALAIKSAERAGTPSREQHDTWQLLDQVSFANVRALVGLDAVAVAMTGAAPIPRALLEWFNAIGVPLSELYGMSESSGPMTWSPEANRPGSVGQAIPGCEVKLADDGEVICRGGNVFRGYFKQPDTTAETVIDGWLHTGDIGELDDEGYLRIVDRKKDLIITSGGKTISPANLEAALKTIPLVGQAAAIGDQRKFVAAILVLDPENAAMWARKHGKEGASTVDLAGDPELRAEVQAGLDEVNKQFAQAAQIKRFTLVGQEWLADGDVLSPTSKLKRRGINARYAAEIEAMYAEAP
jgi:long-chain acyl-CoA synthetase